MKHQILLTITLLLTIIGATPTFAQKTSDYNYRKGLELLEENKLEEALKFFEKQIEEDPKHSDSYFYRGRISAVEFDSYAHAISDITKAIRYWKKGCEIYESTLYWWRGTYYKEVGLFDNAIADYSSAYRLAQKDNKSQVTTALEHRADLYYHLKDYDAADADYHLMLKHNEMEVSAFIGLARNMIARGQYKEAVDMLDRAERFNKNYYAIYKYRMQAYDKLGETDKSIDDAFRYYENDDNANPDLYIPYMKKHASYAFAKCDERIHNSEEPLQWEALKLELYEATYSYEKAIALYNKIEAEYGTDPYIYEHRSECFAELGDYEAAIAEITKYLNMEDCDDYIGYAYRAYYYRESGQYDAAIADYDKVVELYPTSAFGYYQHGWCFELSGDDVKAMEQYNAGIDIDKSYPYIYLMRGELHLKNSDVDAAKADFEEILKKDTTVEEGSCRHYALHFLGRDEEAAEWQEKLIALNPDNPGNYYDKACLYSRMGRLDEAVASLRSAFEKGFRSFAHIEHDDDMDAIRQREDFKALVAEYKAKPLHTLTASGPDASCDDIAVISEVQMKKMQGGVYEVPCSVNELPLNFIFDTGASSVTISSVEASFMLKNNYLNESDLRGKEYYSVATGEVREGTKIRIGEIKIGDAVLRNVEASVVHNQKAPLLLGQTVLERFGTITIDNINSKLIIKQ